MRSKLKDLSEKLQEDISDMDEREHMQLLDRIDKDYENEKVKNVDEVSDHEILKEEDFGTDMWDFELYLLETFGSKVAT